MASNKILAALFLITLNMQLVVSSGIQKTSSSDKSTPLAKKRGSAPKPRKVLVDTNNTVSPVEIPRRSDGELGTLQELASDTEINPVLEDATNAVNGGAIRRSSQVTSQGSVWQRLSSWMARLATEKFTKFIKKRNYRMARCLAITIKDDDLLKLACSTVKTIEKYNGILSHLKSHNMVASFYLYGDIEVVKRAIIESVIYDDYDDYLDGGDLETAFPLALEKERWDRVIELLDIRKGITAEKDEQFKREGKGTSFERFVYHFLDNLAPWEGGTELGRFLILRGDEFRNNHPDILDTLCQELVCNLSDQLHLPKAERLLVDLIGQPSLLTPVVFAEGFLIANYDGYRSDFIKYGYRETIQEGLKSEYEYGGEKLWRVMQTERPDQFPGKFPDTEVARTAVCLCFPTKQQMEDEWIKKYEKWIRKNALILFNELKPHGDIFNLLPDVIWSIISEYTVTLNDLEDLTVPQE